MNPGSLNLRSLPERLFQILRLMHREFPKMEGWTIKMLFFRLPNSKIAKWKC